MALWKITTKRSATINSIRIEKGMTVEIVTSSNSNPLSTLQGREQIASAFMTKYGIDMKKACQISYSNMDTVMVK